MISYVRFKSGGIYRRYKYAASGHAKALGRRRDERDFTPAPRRGPASSVKLPITTGSGLSASFEGLSGLIDVSLGWLRGSRTDGQPLPLAFRRCQEAARRRPPRPDMATRAGRRVALSRRLALFARRQSPMHASSVKAHGATVATRLLSWRLRALNSLSICHRLSPSTCYYAPDGRLR